jgi:hypothetical protein
MVVVVSTGTPGMTVIVVMSRALPSARERARTFERAISGQGMGLGLSCREGDWWKKWTSQRIQGAWRGSQAPLGGRRFDHVEPVESSVLAFG